MRSLILTEGCASWGQGHLTRCLAISQGLHALGIQTKWLIHGDELAEAFLKANGISGAVQNWLDGALASEDLEDFNICIADSYHASLQQYEMIANRVSKCLWVDDEARIDYPRGYVLNVNPLIAAQSLRDGSGGKYLLSGYDYQPLRREFKPTLRTVRDKIKNVLISMGGTDVAGLTEKFVSLVRDRIPESHIYAVVPLKRLRDAWECLQSDSCTLLPSQSALQMKRLMDLSDIAITAGGQTICETACVGLPTIAIGVVENQRKHLDALSSREAVVVAGWHDDIDICTRVSDCIRRLESIKVRQALSEKGQSVIDGRGVERIAAALGMAQ